VDTVFFDPPKKNVLALEMVAERNNCLVRTCYNQVAEKIQLINRAFLLNAMMNHEHSAAFSSAPPRLKIGGETGTVRINVTAYIPAQRWLTYCSSLHAQLRNFCPKYENTGLLQHMVERL